MYVADLFPQKMSIWKILAKILKKVTTLTLFTATGYEIGQRTSEPIIIQSENIRATQENSGFSLETLCILLVVIVAIAIGCACGKFTYVLLKKASRNKNIKRNVTPRPAERAQV